MPWDFDDQIRPLEESLHGVLLVGLHSGNLLQPLKRTKSAKIVRAQKSVMIFFICDLCESRFLNRNIL